MVISKNDSESSMESVLVQMFDCNDNFYGEISTDDLGYFEFLDVPQGEYYIKVNSQDGFDLEMGSDSDLTTLNGDGETICFAIDNITQIHVEVAFIPLSSVGDFVWLDTNADGLQSGGEEGISDLQIDLLDENNEVLQTVSTDNNGAYLIEGIRPGFYTLRLSEFDDNLLPTILQNDEFVDSNLEDKNGEYSVSVYCFDGSNDLSLDMGLVEEQTIISGFVFDDLNQDGIRDGEPGLRNVDVFLNDASGNQIETVTTGSDGNYVFSDVLRGEYFLTFELLDDYEFTQMNVGGDDQLDSDVDQNGETELFDVETGDIISDISAGMFTMIEVPTFNIDGYVWEDQNGDGLLDVSNESAVNGIVVNLYDENDILIQSVETFESNDSRDGYYIFENVHAGNYYISFELDDSVQSTLINIGNDVSISSSINSDNRTEVFELVDSSIENINAGFYFYSTIGDYVWLDANDNGFQDDFESGLNDYVIRLIDDNLNLIATTTSQNGTNGSGFYNFENVAPGRYYVRIDLQAGIVFSQALMGGINSDSDITNENGPGSTYMFDILSGQNITNIDLGLVPQRAQVGNRVWEDYNANGVQDVMEPGINDVLVKLYTHEGILVDEQLTVTNNFEAGYYLFDDVVPGEYYISFEISDEFKPSPSNMGGDDSRDSDIDNSLGLGTTSIFELSSGEIDFDVDGGIYVPIKIGDLVWFDSNMDGIQDNDEVGYEGLTVELYDQDDELIARTTTDENGNYLFDDISAGTYYLNFNTESDLIFTPKEIGGDPRKDSNVNALGLTSTFDIASREERLDIDAGLTTEVNLISGQAWSDDNFDGILNANEPLIPNVTVWLLDGSGTFVLDETVTNEFGNYIFNDLADGTYVIQFLPLSGNAFTGQDFGSDDTVDSDCDALGYVPKMILSGGNTVVRHVSAGYADITKASLSSVYPNPVQGTSFKLDIHNRFPTANINYTIVDGQGGKVRGMGMQEFQSGNYSFDVPTDDLESGIYFIKVRIRNVTEYHKLMIFR